MLILSSFITFLGSYSVQYNVLLSLSVLSEGILTSFVFGRYFYTLCNPVILVFHTLVFNWKTSLENV